MISDQPAANSFPATLDAIIPRLPEKLRKPKVGIICGSGLGGLVDTLREIVLIPYDTIPGFAQSSVPGHKSSLAFGIIGAGEGVPVVAMLGRFHPYEGHKLSTVVYPVRVMAKLGVTDVIVTNASGALNPDLAVGTSVTYVVVVIHDHLALPNLTGMNPLLGPLISPEHPRFLAVSDAYSASLRRLVFLASHQLSLGTDALAEGVYAWVSGPTYESPAEGRFLRNAGADVVGMSTVPEVVAARQEGLNVLALSLVTNAVVIPDKYRSVKEEVKAELMGKAIELSVPEVVSHAEVLTIGQEKGNVMRQLVERVIEMLSHS
ncbi:nucleoside phosphorylase domain-containing protein [Desarmillaria tabescens]|uniref:Purine nucleoside phosphorylase n=1 Tax=Armillaria tabescens TaxID=1929756 RepID=A0AA39T788_ARMTA|nr:nucleoside phosphorylase domain-containing protein [Desarmillaria tabescens]KAK0469331.1 nucleoside phosphorylase domain-containing protein [Desarmillaria tabescens]